MGPYAIIDLGTNTFNLIIFKKELDGSFEIIFKTQLPVKLGEKGINNNVIHKDAFERGLIALLNYKALMDLYKVKKFRAIGTSALRNAKNAKEFCKEALEKTSINIEIIDGKKEANLIYEGVILAMPIPKENSLIMDIGGGSVEFIFCKNGKQEWSESFHVGAARLVEMFNQTDPISDKEIAALNVYLENKLQSLLAHCKENPIGTLIGSSGSFDSFMEMMELEFKNQELHYDKTAYVFDLKNLKILLNKIIKSNKVQRENFPGLIAFRADMIVISALLCKFILEQLQIKKMYLSTYALKEGLIFEM